MPIHESPSAPPPARDDEDDDGSLLRRGPDGRWLLNEARAEVLWEITQFRREKRPLEALEPATLARWLVQVRPRDLAALLAIDDEEQAGGPAPGPGQE